MPQDIIKQAECTANDAKIILDTAKMAIERALRYNTFIKDSLQTIMEHHKSDLHLKDIEIEQLKAKLEKYENN